MSHEVGHSAPSFDLLYKRTNRGIWQGGKQNWKTCPNFCAKNENRPRARIASSVQSRAENPLEVPKPARGQMRAIASDNHSTQARRLRGPLTPINTSFPATARWKRCVPGNFRKSSACRVQK